MLDERRINRSSRTHEAMHLQLESSRQAASCSAMVLVDEEGLCLAASGDMPHDEIAAYTAMVGGKVENFEGTLYSKSQCWNVRIRRFSTQGTRLFMCAVGGQPSRGDAIHTSIGGVSRILAN